MLRILSVIFISAICSFSQAQPQFSDTLIELRNIAQGVQLPVGIGIHNPDTVSYHLKLQHICGCTEFEKTQYEIPANTTIYIPVKYNSSGNAGRVVRGYFINYSSKNLSGIQKISFIAFVDTIHPWTTPVVDSAFCYRFDRLYINCGNIEEGVYQNFVYHLYNCSTKPLIIKNVQSSCGCVSPQWPQEPIKPGETVEIIAKFNSIGRQGSFQKNIYVTLQDGSGVALTLSGNVVPERDQKVGK